MIRKTITYFLVIIAFSCNNNNEDNNDKQPDETNVAALIADKDIYRPSLSFTGNISPFREANLGTAIPGKVKKLHFAKGEYVPKGSLIVQLSGEAATMARHEYESLNKEYERIARLHEKESATKQDYDQVKAKFKAAKSKYEFFKNNSEIRAPFSGVVAEYLVNEGETFTFSPGLEPNYSHTSGIVRLMQMDPVKVKIDVSENLIPQLDNVIKTTIKTDVFPKKQFKGNISFIKPVLSTSSRTATVEVTVENPKNKLMPGMFARVNLKMGVDSLIFIPRHAILERENKTGYLWAIKNGRSQKQRVSVILEQNGKFAIKGIQQGDTIAVSGLNNLTENKIVNITKVK